MFPRLCATPTTASHVRCPPPLLIIVFNEIEDFDIENFEIENFEIDNFDIGKIFVWDQRVVVRREGQLWRREGFCAKRRRGRASHVRGSRRGRAEAREHAGDIPTCPGTEIGLIPKISFPATFPSLPLNGLRLAHLA